MNSDPLFLVLVGYGALVVLMLVLWGVQVVLRNASIADVFCAGLIVIVLWYARYGFGDPERKLLVAFMVCVYAGRLGLFLLFNRVIGKAEDARYQEMRRTWGLRSKPRCSGTSSCKRQRWPPFLPFLVLIQNPRPRSDSSSSQVSLYGSRPFLVRPLPTGNWRGSGRTVES